MWKLLLAVLTSLVLVVGVVVPAMASNKSTVAVAVKLSGNLVGSNYLVQADARLETSTKYRETTLKVRVLRTGQGGDDYSPLITVKFANSKLVCETSRSWIWSTAEGSTLILTCNRYVAAKPLKKLKKAAVSSPSY